MEPKTFLFFAFANSDPEWGKYLRHLNREQHALSALFRPLERERKCTYIEKANAGIDELVQVLDDKEYRGKIAILHFSGHGNTECLLIGVRDFLLKFHGVILNFFKEGENLVHFIIR